MKLKCECGKILSDSAQTEMEKNWGYIKPNGEWFEFESKLAEILAPFCEAFKRGDHLQWLKENCDVYSDQDLKSTIEDIVTYVELEILTGAHYAKCSECGTLMLQKTREGNEYVPYKPKKGNRSEEI